jgi:anaerobic dimethyl sulfoxide reductase subunit C (anchor subunit)
MSEWPLVVFTMALQLSCGLALSATLFDRSVRKSDEAVIRLLGISIFPIAAVGLMVSLFHLGRPLSAWRALSNLPGSWLSVEVLLSCLFALASLAYAHRWWSRGREGRFALGVVTGLVGLAAVVSSSMIYLVPGQPAWNSAWVPMSFLGTTMVLGGLFPICLGDLKSDKGFLTALSAAVAVGGLLLVVSANWMIAGISRPSADDFASARLHEALLLVLSQHLVWFVLHVVLAGVLPVAFAFSLLSSGKAGLGGLVLVAVTAGAAIGRILMYLVGTAAPPF